MYVVVVHSYAYYGSYDVCYIMGGLLGYMNQAAYDNLGMSPLYTVYIITLMSHIYWGLTIIYSVISYMSHICTGECHVELYYRCIS